MPLRDGTGPLGFGPGTGRNKGWCRTGLRFSPFRPLSFGVRNRWLLGFAVPAIFAAIRDLANPQGLLRQLAHGFLTEKKKDRRDISPVTKYTVIEENRPSPKTPVDDKGGAT